MSEKKRKSKEERQQSKVDKFTQQKELEAKRTGIDQPIDIGPLGAERKARIDTIMKEGVKEDFLGGLKKIQDLRTAPDVTVPDIPKADYNIKDVRRERRAKIADVLTGLGSGLRGEKVSPSIYQDKIKSERDKQYQQYRDTSIAAKKRLGEWESAYIDEQLDYLSSLEANRRTTDRELKQIEILKRKIKARKKLKLVLKKRNYDIIRNRPKKGEQYATETYETSTGKTIRRPILVDDNKLEQEIDSDIELKRQLEPIENKIENAQKELNILKMDASEDDSALSSVDIATKQAKINALKAKRDKLIQGDKSKGTSQTKTKGPIQNKETTPTSKEDDIWDL